MLSRRCFVLHRNHEFGRTDIPIIEQGFKECKKLVIEDDCWIGMNSLLTPDDILEREPLWQWGVC